MDDAGEGGGVVGVLALANIILLMYREPCLIV